MKTYGLGDSLHRLVKQAIDSGVATTIEEAESIFRRYSLGFEIDAAEARDPLHQAALLTGVALARRVFMGGVTVAGMVEVPLCVPLPLGATLAEAIVALGGSLRSTPAESPIINIGGRRRARARGFHVRAQFEGWRGGIVPVHSEASPVSGHPMPLAAMLSAALAVNEAFLYVGCESGAAGRRAVGLSLWQPSSRVDWLADRAEEPDLQYLPSQLWLIGLGHLGQAYLWGLGILPYSEPGGLSLVLQDVDRATPSSESTSVLTDSGIVGQMKTRAMAVWAESRGFATVIQERLFDGSFQRQSNEPPVALCGIDNALGRRALDCVGFPLVVEAGLGQGHRDFRAIRLHTLPGPRSATEIWKGSATDRGLPGQAAYRKLLTDGELDRCGVTLLAGKAVGAPFVGSVAACLVLSEVLRLLHGGPLHSVVELDLQSVEHRSAVVRESAYPDFNPGFVPAGQSRPPEAVTRSVAEVRRLYAV